MKHNKMDGYSVYEFPFFQGVFFSMRYILFNSFVYLFVGGCMR